MQYNKENVICLLKLFSYWHNTMVTILKTFSVFNHSWKHYRIRWYWYLIGFWLFKSAVITSVEILVRSFPPPSLSDPQYPKLNLGASFHDREFSFNRLLTLAVYVLHKSNSIYFYGCPKFTYIHWLEYIVMPQHIATYKIVFNIIFVYINIT